MRWLFLIVLSLNFAYVGWQMSLPDTASYANVPPLRDVQPIVLLSELKGSVPEKVELDESIAVAAADVKVNIKEAANSGVSVAPDIVYKEGVDKEGADKDGDQRDGDEKDRADKVAVDIKQVTEKAAVRATGEDKESVAVAEVNVQAERCFTMGPFRDLDKLRGLTREIKSYVVSADFRGLEEKEQSLYWVYVNPEKSRKKAIETGARLKAKKIKDFYVIREGEKKNGLSLGRFKNKKGAYGLADRVRKLGFAVTIEPVFKTYTVYWLDYQLADGATIPESIFEKHIKSATKDQVGRLSRECGA